MKKIALAVLVAAGALAAAGAAQGKELQSLKVCGSNGCKETTDAEALRGWEAQGDPVQVAHPTPAAFYTVDVGFGDGGKILHSDTAYWLPKRSVMRFKGQVYDPWWELFASQKAMLTKVAAGIEPFVPRLKRVRVKGKEVADPDSYLRLFKEFRYAIVPLKAHKYVRIVMRAAEPNPWVEERVILKYAPKIRLLVRPDGYYKLPKKLGRKVMRRLSLTASGGGGTAPVPAAPGSAHTTLYAGIGLAGFAALVAVGACGAAVRRKGSDS